MSKRWPDKILVGLTGNIATGKSAVMRMAAEKGALVIDADKIVHKILDSDTQVQSAITAAFGQDLISKEGRIDRAALGAIVFADSHALKKLEAILHPAVGRIIFQRIDKAPAGPVFIEAIKLLEGSLAAICDQIWVTRCPAETQIQRLVVCRGLERSAALTRIRAQSLQKAKVARADVVIDTDGAMSQTQAYFDLAWRRLNRKLPPEARPGAANLDKVGEAQAVRKRARIKNVTIRRARPADVPAISLLIRQATGGAVAMKRAEMLMALGERGYLIGQRVTEISAVAGWSSENLIGRIDHLYVYPLEAAPETGGAILDEIIATATGLICEVILAVLPADEAPEILTLFSERDFIKADPADLPEPWQKALGQVSPERDIILMKVLRQTRPLKASAASTAA